MSDIVSIVDLVAARAARDPDLVALADPRRRAEFTAGAPRDLTYGEFRAGIASLADTLRDFELPGRSVIATQMANTVEAAVTLLAITAAGHIAAPLPLLWRRADLRHALTEVDAKAFVVTARIAASDHADLARHVAFDVPSIRYVAAFGDELPDGIVRLDLAAGADIAPPIEFTTLATANDIALMTFAAEPGSAGAVAHTHAELLASGFALLREAGIPRRARIASAMLMSSYVAVSALIASLISGGTLALEQPGYGDAIDAPSDVALVPAALLPQLAASAMPLPSLIAVWRAPEQHAESRSWPRNSFLTDVLAFGEAGHAVMRRAADGHPAALRPGVLRAARRHAGAPAVLEIARSERQTLLVGGPIAPHFDRDGSAREHPLIDTGIPCQIDPVTQRLTLGGGPHGVAAIGGYRFVMADLQDLVGAIDPASVLTPLPDPLSGNKLAGASPNTAALRAALDNLGVNPLVSRAFRDRDSA